MSLFSDHHNVGICGTAFGVVSSVYCTPVMSYNTEVEALPQYSISWYIWNCNKNAPDTRLLAKIYHLQDRQCTLNVTLRCVQETIVAVEKQKVFLYLRACVCAHGRGLTLV